MLFEAIVFGLLGLIVGSFLNVVILRHGARTLGGRSGCMACGRQLQWFDMIPVLSWVFLRGKCRSCRAVISVQYPLVEALTAVLFVLIGLSALGIFVKILSLAIAGFLVIIAAYDLRHTIIPDEWSYGFAGLAFLVTLAGLVGEGETLNILLSLLAGPLAAFPLFALWAISQGKWMGLGDPKLALGIGWLLGVPAGLYAVFFAFVIGAVISVFILMPLEYVRNKSGITHLGAARPGLTMKSEVPFGPFLVASCIVVWGALMYGMPILFFI